MTDCLLAFLPDPVICLGQKLEPYSLAHEMALRRHGSRFLDAGENPGGGGWATELYLAVYLCCHRWPELQDELARPDFTQRIADWRKQFGETEADPIADEFSRFMAYLKAGHECPDYEVMPILGRSLVTPGAPMPVVLLQALCGELHLSMDEAMNLPLPAAHWMYLGRLERNGRIRISSNLSASLHSALAKKAAEFGMVLQRYDAEPDHPPAPPH